MKYELKVIGVAGLIVLGVLLAYAWFLSTQGAEPAEAPREPVETIQRQPTEREVLVDKATTTCSRLADQVQAAKGAGLTDKQIVAMMREGQNGDMGKVEYVLQFCSTILAVAGR